MIVSSGRQPPIQDAYARITDRPNRGRHIHQELGVLHRVCFPTPLDIEVGFIPDLNVQRLVIAARKVFHDSAVDTGDAGVVAGTIGCWFDPVLPTMHSL